MTHEDDRKKGRFFLLDEFGGESEITYVYAGPKKLIISHTGVSEHLSGQGIGKKLVTAVVSFSRQNDLKILPLCPFAKAIMSKDDQYQDVLF